MMDKISVIIPAYNAEKYLPRTLDSILSQTYKNLEVVIVNDGSTDHTGDIIKKYASADKRVRGISQTNQGTSSARLQGVREADGDWIGFVDSDDIIDSDMYEILLANAKKENADISHCGYQMVLTERTDYYYNTGKYIVQSNEEAVRDLLSGEFVEPGLCNKLFKRSLFSALLNNNAFDVSIKNYEDLLMNFYLFREARCAVYSDFCPYHYLVRRNSSATATNLHVYCDPIKVLYIILKETEKSERLNAVVRPRMVFFMIRIAGMPNVEQVDMFIPFRKKIRKGLRKNLKKILKDKVCTARTKILAVCVSVCPAGFTGVNRIYRKIKCIYKH